MKRSKNEADRLLRRYQTRDRAIPVEVVKRRKVVDPNSKAIVIGKRRCFAGHSLQFADTPEDYEL